VKTLRLAGLRSQRPWWEHCDPPRTLSGTNSNVPYRCGSNHQSMRQPAHGNRLRRSNPPYAALFQSAVASAIGLQRQEANRRLGPSRRNDALERPL